MPAWGTQRFVRRRGLESPDIQENPEAYSLYTEGTERPKSVEHLPVTFANRDITSRLPHEMSGELNIFANRRGVLFPDGIFLHNVDKPFEVHRMVVRLALIEFSGLGNDVQEIDSDTLDRRVRLRVTDFVKNEKLTKSASLVDLLFARNTGLWEWREPYTLVRSEGFRVQVDVTNLPVYCVPDPINNCQPIAFVSSTVNVAVSFQGYLIVVAPPLETR